jgi:hypothetical protein
MGLFKKKDQVVIDLRDRAVEVRGPSFDFGFPTRCPDCGGRGYLDHIDVGRRIQYEHCPSCFAKWERSEADVLALNG